MTSVPQRGHLRLNVRRQLEVVDANAPFAVGPRLPARPQVVAKEARDLLGGPLVRPGRLHHLVEQADVERDDRDGRGGLRDQPLVDAHVGGAAHPRREQRRELRGRLLQVFLGLPDGPRAVDRERQRRTDVAVGHRAAARRQQIGVRQRAHPGGEVLAPHDLAGRLHLGVRGGRDLDRHHLLVSEVDALAAERRAERLQDRAVGDAGAGIDALGRRQAVDDEVELAARLLEPRDRLVLDLAAEGVAVDDRAARDRRRARGAGPPPGCTSRPTPSSHPGAAAPDRPPSRCAPYPNTALRRLERP